MLKWMCFIVEFCRYTTKPLPQLLDEKCIDSTANYSKHLVVLPRRADADRPAIGQWTPR